MKINTIGHLVKTNPIQSQYKANQTQSCPPPADSNGQKVAKMLLSGYNYYGVQRQVILQGLMQGG